MSTLLGAINAAASALDAQRARMEVAVSNMANAESTRGPDGQPYRRREVVLETQTGDSFGGRIAASGVRVAQVVEDQSPFRRRLEPSHPDADADGFVAVPNVDVPEEMVDMLGAARAYQANLTAIGLIRDTVQKALDLAK
jgi:flagellar basal-body rod protein FlgC